MSKRSPVAFDDLDRLNEVAAEGRFGPFGEAVEVTQAMIDAFAEVTGDRQWIHNDVERARRESPLGATIAQGFLLVSLLNRLTEGDRQFIAGHSRIVNFGCDRLRFLKPVPAGQSIHARQRVLHVRRKGPQATQITFETDVAMVNGDSVMAYRALVLFFP